MSSTWSLPPPVSQFPQQHGPGFAPCSTRTRITRKHFAAGIAASLRIPCPALGGRLAVLASAVSASAVPGCALDAFAAFQQRSPRLWQASSGLSTPGLRWPSVRRSVACRSRVCPVQAALQPGQALSAQPCRRAAAVQRPPADLQPGWPAPWAAAAWCPRAGRVASLQQCAPGASRSCAIPCPAAAR